tara:strand:- start:17630 stop:18025 length:396 start_codon:yes stop_codon:yes gene_type:complete
MILQITNSQRDMDELKYYEDVYITDDSINVESKQLPAFTIVEDSYYNGDNNNYRVNCRIGCKLGTTEGMKQHIAATDKILNPMIFQGNTLWTYEKINAFNTVAECKEFIEDYINEDVTIEIFNAQKDLNDS